MTDVDEFASSLLEEAKRFHEKSSDPQSIEASNAFLHASLFLAFSSLEAHINAVCSEFVDRPELSIHEKALLLEEEVVLKKGRFERTGLRMYRLEERLEFLYSKFSNKKLNKEAGCWVALKHASKLRNKLTHPKEARELSVKDVGDALQAIVETIDALYIAVYKKGLPAAKRGLQSKLTF